MDAATQLKQKKGLTSEENLQRGQKQTRSRSRGHLPAAASTSERKLDRPKSRVGPSIPVTIMVFMCVITPPPLPEYELLKLAFYGALLSRQVL